MAQSLIQTQTQTQQQLQRLSQQQLLQVRLISMPLTELEQNVQAELDDNPALEVTTPGESDEMNSAESPSEDSRETEESEHDSDVDAALEGLESDDELPTAYSREADRNADYEEMVYGDTTSFYDKLKEQLGTQPLSPKQHDILEYLIGSLDDDGLLHKDLDSIVDELAIYHNIDTNMQEVEHLLRVLQTFDPAGVGARSLQECLALQVKRRPKSELNTLVLLTLQRCFREISMNNWDAVARQMKLSDSQVEAVRSEIRKLNPKPGASMGETQGRNINQITPDFIVDTDDEGHVSFTLNDGGLPELTVSPSFADMVQTYKDNKHTMTRTEKEALLYAREKVERARGYIEAIQRRRETLRSTMQAIIDWQKRYFQDGDEADLRPMILKDIAEKTHLDISTISRVCNVKYAQTRWGTFPLRYFFSDSYTSRDGEELSSRQARRVLKDIVDKEDPQQPLSDDELARRMQDAGYPIARRTVSKYREELGIPSAKYRKK